MLQVPPETGNNVKQLCMNSEAGCCAAIFSKVDALLRDSKRLETQPVEQVHNRIRRRKRKKTHDEHKNNDINIQNLSQYHNIIILLIMNYQYCQK